MTLERQIAEFWTYVENAWDIESRAEIEALAKKLGCGPLFLAAHHTWKRNPQVAKLRSALESIANSSCCGCCQEAARVAQRALEPGQ